MNMKKTASVLSFALLAIALSLAACDPEERNSSATSQLFNYDLRGTWISDSPKYTGYDGKLEIDYSYITISGYQGYIGFYPESTRPFTGLSNGPLRGYSVKTGSVEGYTGHKGTININDPIMGEITIIYTYWETGGFPNKQKRLHVSHAGWEDTLKPAPVDED
jgi:hypothetical protein